MASGPVTAAWCVSIVERAWHQVGAGNERYWVTALEVDHDNVRAALEWAIGAKSAVGLRLAAALTPFWKTRGYLREGQEWLRRALESTADAVPALRARALYGLGMLAIMQGDVALAHAGVEESLSLARAGRFRRAEAQGLNLLGFISIFAQDPMAAKPVLEESVALARADGDVGSLISALSLYGRARLLLGDVEGAGRVFQECLELEEDSGDAPAAALMGLGWTALLAGSSGAPRSCSGGRSASRQEWGTDSRRRWSSASWASWPGAGAGWPRPPTCSRRGVPSPWSWAPHSRWPDASTGWPTWRWPRGTTTGRPRWSTRRARWRARPSFRTRWPGPCWCGATSAVPVGTPGRLRAAYDEALSLARANSDSGAVAMALARLAALARLRTADDDAMNLLSEALTMQASSGDGGVVSSLEAMAGLAVDQGRGPAAAGLFGAAEAMRAASGSVRAPSEIAQYEADVAALRAAVAPEELEPAWAKGAAMSRDDAVALALRGRGIRDRPSHGWASLSPTERQIVDLVADGLTNKEIGDRLSISHRTVQGHLSRVFPKLGLRSRREIREALRQR